jgi:UDP-N-acetylmuramoyl-L-alanyl-D-glutamate--2,6-diaminopimelate ligase
MTPTNPPQSRFEFNLVDALPVPVTNLVNDSRLVKAGDTFLAYPGQRVDGRQFIPQAIAQGANAIVWEAQGYLWDPAWQVPNLPVPQLRNKVGEFASEVYGRPTRQLCVIGITGTNGKTSCSHWLAQALSQAGRPAAIIGTLGNGFPEQLEPSPNTTPDPIVLQKSLQRYLQQGATCAAMEVSSHALDQGRVNGVHFEVALFTNLSREHLDYHGDMKRYASAKSALFTWPELRHAVINGDDPYGRELRQKAEAHGVQVIGYGFDGGEVRGSNLRVGPQGLAFDVTTPWGAARLESSVLGRFNAHNLLAVLATLLVGGVPFEQAMVSVQHVQPVPGRMQQIRIAGKPLVVVDYAHTPDALEKVLITLREISGESKASGAQLICVFGCGGQRDKGKRPVMGDVAARLADAAVVTSDNPRNEEPRAIIDDIVAGMADNYHVQEDRAAAIDYAIAHAKAADLVLIAGKGHEDYQEIKGVRLPFSDVEVALRSLDRYGKSKA